MEFYSGQHLSANCLNGLVTRVNNLCNQLRALQGQQATANLGKTYFPRRASEGGGETGYWTRMPINLPPFTRFDVVRDCRGTEIVESYLQGGSWVSGVEGIHTLPTVRLCKREPALLYIEPTEYRSVEGGTAGLGLSLYASCSYFAFPNLQLLADERCQYACVPINQLCRVMRTEFRCGTEAQVCRMEFKKASLRLFKQYWAGDIRRPDLYDIRREHFGYSVDLECSTLSISQGVAVLYPPVIQSGCTMYHPGDVLYGNSAFTGCSLHPRMVLIPCATIRTNLCNSSVLTYFYRCDCSSCEKPSAWTTNIKNCNGCVIGTCTTCWTLPDPCYNYGYNWRDESKSAMYVPCWECAWTMLQFYDFDTEVNYSGWSDPCFHACNRNIGRNGHNHPEIVPVGRFYTRTETVRNTCGCVRTEADGSKTTEVLSEVHEWRTFCINKTPMVIYDRSLNGIGTFWRWYSDCGRERDIACVRAQYYHWATGATTCCRLVPCLWGRASSAGQCNRLVACRVPMTDVFKCLPPQYFYVPAPKDCWYNYNTEANDG